MSDERPTVGPLNLSEQVIQVLADVGAGMAMADPTGQLSVDPFGDDLPQGPPIPKVEGYHAPGPSRSSNLPPPRVETGGTPDPPSTLLEAPKQDSSPLEAGEKALNFPLEKEGLSAAARAQVIREVLESLTEAGVLLNPGVSVKEGRIDAIFKTIPQYSSGGGESTTGPDEEPAATGAGNLSFLSEEVQFYRLGGVPIQLSLKNLGITKEAAKTYITDNGLMSYFLDPNVSTACKVYKLLHLSERGLFHQRTVRRPT